MDVRLETGSYVLRDIIRNVALSTDGEESDVRITCVELWGMHLMFKHGTSSNDSPR
jgi:hypothetical protein